LKFEKILIFFPWHKLIFILARPSGPNRLSRLQSRIVARMDGANFDASFRQILGMESEILWESEITPTLDEEGIELKTW
jgi:hypothetical protein